MNDLLKQFTKDLPVRYVPLYANGDPTHKDCEDGVVSSCNDKFVFVRYGLDTYSKATNPRDLVLR